MEREFEKGFAVIEKGLAERDKSRVGLRWPLAKAIVMLGKGVSLNKEMKEIVARQLNVKKVEVKSGDELAVRLDLKLTLELEAEGFARELARKVQAERKRRGFEKKDLIELEIYAVGDLKVMLESQREFIGERTNSKGVVFVEGKGKVEFEIKGKKVGIRF